MTPQGHVALISSKDHTWQINSLQQLSGDDQFLLQTLSLTFEACGRVHCVAEIDDGSLCVAALTDNYRPAV